MLLFNRLFYVRTLYVRQFATNIVIVIMCILVSSNDNKVVCVRVVVIAITTG